MILRSAQILPVSAASAFSGQFLFPPPLLDQIFNYPAFSRAVGPSSLSDSSSSRNDKLMCLCHVYYRDRSENGGSARTSLCTIGPLIENTSNVIFANLLLEILISPSAGEKSTL